jgi:membrane protease YdiL (CAAX protease family)
LSVFYLSVISYSLIILAIFNLWVTTQKISWILFLAAISVGIVNDNMTFQGFFYIFILALELIVYYSLSYEKLGKPILGCAIALLGILLINHYLPGFGKWKAITKTSPSIASKSFTIYFNFDKMSIGFLMLSLALPLISSRSDWMKVLKTSAIYGVIGLVVLVIPALLSRYIAFDPKVPAITPIWMVQTLFFTCIPEECFFRGFIQKQAAIFLRYSKNGTWIAIFAGAVMFSLQDLRSLSWRYFVISLLTGIVYGIVYKKTDRIEAPILTHFAVNLGHMLLFTYPTVSKTYYQTFSTL